MSALRNEIFKNQPSSSNDSFSKLVRIEWVQASHVHFSLDFFVAANQSAVLDSILLRFFVSVKNLPYLRQVDPGSRLYLGSLKR